MLVPMSSKIAPGMLLIGIGVGFYLPGLPAQASIVNPYIGMILIIVGIIALLKA